MKIYPCITLNDSQVQQYLTPAEIAQITPAKSKKTAVQPVDPIPVRLTINSMGEISNITRIGDRHISPQTVGRNASFFTCGKNKTYTFDALLCPVVAGGFVPGQGQAESPSAYLLQIPFSRETDLTGCVHQEFRLRSTYLPLTANTQPRQVYQTMHHAIATVDIATQSVIALSLYAEDGEPPENGTVVDDSVPGQISVSCYLANGGCNFDCVIN